MNSKLFLGIAIIIVSFALIFFWVWPVYKDWDKNRDELSELKELTEQMQKASNSVGAFDGGDYFEDLSKLKQAMPIGSASEELLVTFESLATNNGLLLNSIDFTEPKEEKVDLIAIENQGLPESVPQRNKNELKTLLIQVELTGSYSSLRSFFKDCEQNVRVINPKKITFSRVSGLEITDQSSGLFKYNIEFEAYYLKEITN